MRKPEVEYFTEDIEDAEYLNVGLVWENDEGEEVRAVLGAFEGEPEEKVLLVIRALVEQAVCYVQGIET